MQRVVFAGPAKHASITIDAVHENLLSVAISIFAAHFLLDTAANRVRMSFLHVGVFAVSAN